MNNKISIRPEIADIDTVPNISDIEYFQNNTLRPIIKLQHTLLIAFYKKYSSSRKTDFKAIGQEKTEIFIEDTLSKDNKLKYKVLGIIIGHFTVEEFNVYHKKSSEFNKRIIGIIKKRLKDSIPELR